MNKLFGNRRTLYFTLAITMVCIFTLTVAYAALSTVLEIHGSAEVSAANWDIKLENVKVNSGSVGTTIPIITSYTTASFSTVLNKPGDFYQFTIDVVNDGSIDAMIDSVTKTPELTSEQAKYINYIVEYENGESISTKQLVSAGSFVRLKVRVEYRKDIDVSDLPSSSTILNLSFKVNYTQADENGSSVTDNGVYDPYRIGNEKCFDSECFFVISSSEDTVTMLAKYNLLVGNMIDNINGSVPLENPTGIQDKITEGGSIGVNSFSSTTYWSSTASNYPMYVYNENSNLYEYVENYKVYLESIGIIVNEARLITLEELESLGCVRFSNSCLNAPSWVYSTPYWSGTANSSTLMWIVRTDSGFYSYSYTDNNRGVRPVIVISKDYFN